MKQNPMYIHPTAIVETRDIGKGTRIWEFTHVQQNVKIGKNCNICAHCFIEEGVTIGDNVTIKNGVSVWKGVTIESGAFLGPNCVFTNDIHPRSKHYSEPVPTLVKKGASIGANATILCGHTLGEHCMVGAGCLVNRDVSPKALVVGVPMRFIRYMKKEKGVYI